MAMEKFSRIPKKSDSVNDNDGVGLHDLYLFCYFFFVKNNIENINFLKDSKVFGADSSDRFVSFFFYISSKEFIKLIKSLYVIFDE